LASSALDWLKPGGSIAILGTYSILAGGEAWKEAVRAVARHWMTRAFPAGWADARAGAAVGPDAFKRLLIGASFMDVEVRSFAEPRDWTFDEIVGYLRSTSVCSEGALGDLFSGFEAGLKDEVNRLCSNGRLLRPPDTPLNVSNSSARGFAPACFDHLGFKVDRVHMLKVGCDVQRNPARPAGQVKKDGRPRQVRLSDKARQVLRQFPQKRLLEGCEAYPSVRTLAACQSGNPAAAWTATGSASTRDASSSRNQGSTASRSGARRAAPSALSWADQSSAAPS
jgi:hypothetical protein